MSPLQAFRRRELDLACDNERRAFFYVFFIGLFKLHSSHARISFKHPSIFASASENWLQVKYHCPLSSWPLSQCIPLFSCLSPIIIFSAEAHLFANCPFHFGPMSPIYVQLQRLVHDMGALSGTARVTKHRKRVPCILCVALVCYTIIYIILQCASAFWLRSRASRHQSSGAGAAASARRSLSRHHISTHGALVRPHFSAPRDTRQAPRGSLAALVRASPPLQWHPERDRLHV